MQVGMVILVCWLAVYLVANVVTSTQRVQRQGERMSQEYPKTKEIARALASKSYQRIAYFGDVERPFRTTSNGDFDTAELT